MTEMVVYLFEHAPMLGVAVLIGLAIWRIEKAGTYFRQLSDRLLIEHEILIQDYCDRKNIDIENLATRMKSGLTNR